MIGVGSVISGYRVQRILGSGGMGTVYAVTDPELPRMNALKVMPAEYSANTEFRTRFLREADIAANMDHPNIVSVYDRGETPEGQLWIAMQLVDGTDADAALRSGAMTPARAVHIIAGVGEALDYAHGHKVLHRDIKPANFMLSGPIGRDERVLLGDFGIARSADDAGMTATNAVMTTMAYAAPEVLEGRPVDHRSDLYSLGCALFHLLTGQTPYGDTPGMAAQAMAHLRRPVPRPSDVRPELSAEFDAVIATAMAKDPAQRYNSGRELAQAAAAALRAHSTPSRGYPVPPPGAPGQGGWPAPGPDWSTGEAPKRRRGKVIAAVAGTVVLVAGSVTAVTLMNGSEGEDQPPAPPTTTEVAAPAPTVAPEALPPLLLDAEGVSEILGQTVEFVKEVDGFSNDDMRGSEECRGMSYPLQRTVYANSGATTGFGTVMGLKSVTIDHAVIQGVVPFPSAALTRQFIDRQSTLWRGCAYASLTMQEDGNRPEVVWQLGPSTVQDGVLSATRIASDRSVECQRAITTGGTVVADVSVCLDSGLDNQAVELAKKIAGNAPTGG